MTAYVYSAYLMAFAVAMMVFASASTPLSIFRFQESSRSSGFLEAGLTIQFIIRYLISQITSVSICINSLVAILS